MVNLLYYPKKYLIYSINTINFSLDNNILEIKQFSMNFYKWFVIILPITSIEIHFIKRFLKGLFYILIFKNFIYCLKILIIFRNE